MYSYEDRVRAVRLYLKLGKRVGATIRQLGYPTKNSLKSWHLEYERCHDLRIGYVRSKPVYSAEQKKVAVDHYLDHDRCVATTWRALGYPSRGTLAAWIEELHPEIGKRIVGIRQLQLEHDILKKANELIKKGMGITPQLLSNREK
jgi:transposase-like protein